MDPVHRTYSGKGLGPGSGGGHGFGGGGGIRGGGVGLQVRSHSNGSRGFAHAPHGLSNQGATGSYSNVAGAAGDRGGGGTGAGARPPSPAKVMVEVRQEKEREYMEELRQKTLMLEKAQGAKGGGIRKLFSLKK